MAALTSMSVSSTITSFPQGGKHGWKKPRAKGLAIHSWNRFSGL